MINRKDRGVSWDKNSYKWRAYINVNGKNIFLGYFYNLDDAIAARKQAEIDHKYHKNHGQQNIGVKYMIVYEKGGIIVSDFENIRTLATSTDASQSSMDLGDKNKVVYGTFKLMYEACKDGKNILICGLGGGSLQRGLLAQEPRPEVTSIELDREIIKIARRFFSVPKHKVINRSAEELAGLPKYDRIVVDVFKGSELPSFVETEGYLIKLRKHLTSEGRLTINLGIGGEGLAKLAKEHFNFVDVYSMKFSLNKILVCSDKPIYIPYHNLAELKQYFIQI